MKEILDKSLLFYKKRHPDALKCQLKERGSCGEIFISYMRVEKQFFSFTKNNGKTMPVDFAWKAYILLYIAQWEFIFGGGICFLQEQNKWPFPPLVHSTAALDCNILPFKVYFMFFEIYWLLYFILFHFIFTLCSRLHSNNLYCDCHLAWLSDWLRQRPRVGLYTQCMGPSHLRGHNVAEVQKREFVCNGKSISIVSTAPWYSLTTH